MRARSVKCRRYDEVRSWLWELFFFSISAFLSFFLSISLDDDVVYPSVGGFFLHCSATKSGYGEHLILSVRVSF